MEKCNNCSEKINKKKSKSGLCEKCYRLEWYKNYRKKCKELHICCWGGCKKKIKPRMIKSTGRIAYPIKCRFHEDKGLENLRKNYIKRQKNEN